MAKLVRGRVGSQISLSQCRCLLFSLFLRATEDMGAIWNFDVVLGIKVKHGLLIKTKRWKRWTLPQLLTCKHSPGEVFFSNKKRHDFLRPLFGSCFKQSCFGLAFVGSVPLSSHQCHFLFLHLIAPLFLIFTNLRSYLRVSSLFPLFRKPTCWRRLLWQFLDFSATSLPRTVRTASCWSTSRGPQSSVCTLKEVCLILEHLLLCPARSREAATWYPAVPGMWEEKRREEKTHLGCRPCVTQGHFPWERVTGS